MKLSSFFRVAFNNPREACDRAITFAEFHADRLRPKPNPKKLDSAFLIQQLGAQLGTELECFLAEEALKEIESLVAEKQVQLVNPVFGPPSGHNARLGLARMCYAVCRALRPDVVLETGVCYGVTSSFILQALAINGKGQLLSIDLPPLSRVAGAESGVLIPSHLKSRWKLNPGRIRRKLPQVLAGQPAIDIFLHDSLHTFRNMTYEFQTVWPHLRPRGVLLSDDVAMNGAFEKFFQEKECCFSAVDQSDSFGVVVKGPI